MTHEIYVALEAIAGPHVRKKRTTVLRMAEGLSIGMPIRRILALDETCNGTTWYGKYGADGWKDDPAIARALELALSRAHRFFDEEEGQRMALRLRTASAAQDEIVDLTSVAADVLRTLMLHSESDRIKLDAATEVLDRADQTTARKTTHDVTIGERAGPTMAEINTRRRRRRVIEGEAEVVRTGADDALLLQDVFPGLASGEGEDDGELGD